MRNPISSFAARPRNLILCLVVAAGLSSCGEGPELLPITEQNAMALARASTGAYDMLSEMADFGLGLTEILWYTIEGSGDRSPMVADGDGYLESISVVADDRFPTGVLSAGDSGTIEFDAVELWFYGDPALVDGVARVTIREVVVAEFGPPQLSVDVVFEGLTFRILSVFDGQTIAQFVVDGVLSVELGDDDLGYTRETVSGSFLRIQGRDSVGAFGASMYDFTLEERDEKGGDEYLVWMAGSLLDDELGGVVRCETLEPFWGSDDWNEPDDGQIRLFGANGSSLLIAADSGEVWLSIDADGNDSFEDDVLTSWDELRD